MSAKQKAQLEDLMAWHVEQAAECGQDEDQARDFHLWAATVLAIEGQPKTKLNKRGRRIRAILILAAIVAVFYTIGHVWWTDSGYCWGSATECLPEGN